MRQTLIRPLTLASVLVLAAGLACGRRQVADPWPLPTVKVRLAKDAQGQETDWVAATLTATRRATLSTRIAASVKKVHVNEGQQVPAGTLLVSLSDEDLQSGLKAAQAALEAAAANHRRIDALMKQNAAIPAELDQANTQLAQAQAAVAQVQANLSYTQIRAPFAGVVQSRMVNDGAFVGPGTPLVDIEGQGALELDGTVSDREAKDIRIGTRLPFQAEGRSGLAEITALATGGDPVSHRGTFRARIVKGAESLRTGSFARLQLPHAAAPKPDLQVPTSALVLRGELTGVFVAKDGKAELHWLATGDPEGGVVAVRAGIRPGDQVIDQPGGLVDGQPIEVLR
jgi:RND family efflux transporter MFP subunit